MRSKHYDKYITNLLEGIIFVAAGIFLIYYSVIAGVEKQNWYLWAAGIAVVINTGLYLLGSAFVHKVKADLIKRQKQRREEFQDFTIEQ
ncbi:MAG: hypothetical protein IT214_09605 [Chitinophagaceae bacterium]|jgi:uncharacterized membrane protein|nr:hypothetical protein [Chitinophagaceae bacterium]OQY92159.1 MAG: hypothetical protein B6D37_15245 [Sphingobacteriales bacterium UTBCD1]